MLRNVALLVALRAAVSGCTDSAFTSGMLTSSAPGASQPGTPRPDSQWSGSPVFLSASSDSSCIAGFVTDHADQFPQTANADLQIDSSSARMTLRTSGQQKIVFSGVRSDDTLSLTAHHETSDGWPLSPSMIQGIADVCHAIDVMGDGPYLDVGTLIARIDSSEINGDWTYVVWDPGGGPPGYVNRPMRLTVGLRVHLAR